MLHNFGSYQDAQCFTKKKHISRALHQGIQKPNNATQSVSSGANTAPPQSYIAASSQDTKTTTPELSVINLLGFLDLNVDNHASNSTSTKVDSYFCLTTHLVNLVETLPEFDKFIVDSGAFLHMVNNSILFTNMQQWPEDSTTAHVLLANGNTKAKIHEVGTVRFSFPNLTILEINFFLYVPNFLSLLFSILQHIAYNTWKIIIHHNTLQLIFPTFTIDTAPDDSPPPSAAEHPSHATHHYNDQTMYTSCAMKLITV